MRSVLVSLGPIEWPGIFGIAAILMVAVLLWRRLERILEEDQPQAPLDARWIVGALSFVAALSVALFFLINRFGPVKIRSYGVMLLVGFVAGIIYASRVGPQRGLKLSTIIDLVLLELISAIVGARVMFVALMYKDYVQNPSTVLDVWRGGLSFHGGLLGAVIATLIFSKVRKVRFTVLADILTPAIPIGYALTRIGCLLNGCCHGGPTDLPWGIIQPDSGYTCPLEPTQLYASAGSLVLFAILYWAWPRMHRPGQLFPLYMFTYSILRFLCEYTRRGFSAEVSGVVSALTVAQFACIFIALAGLVWFLILQRRPYENPVEAMAVEPEVEPLASRHGKKKRK